MLHVVTWLWGDKYGPEYFARLHAGVRRNLRQPFRFLVMTERGRELALPDGVERHAIKDMQLIGRGCFVRLRLFDVGWQANRGMIAGDQILQIDLDLVVTGPLDELLDRLEPLVVLQGVNAANPCPYNCSVVLLTAGEHGEVWTQFAELRPWGDDDLRALIPHHDFPDDQGWLWKVAPNAAAFHPIGGVYAFGKPGWPQGENLPVNARIVAFPGGRDPSQYTRLGWVREHWLGLRQGEQAA